MRNQDNKNNLDISDHPCRSFCSRTNGVKFTIIITIILAFVFLAQKERIVGSDQSDETRDSAYLVNEEGCHMLDQVPKDYSYFQKPQPIQCKYKNNSYLLVSSDDNSIWVNEDAMKASPLTKSHNITCCYYENNFPTDSVKCNEKFKYSTICVPFWNKTKVTAEFVKVCCMKKEKVIYIDFHLFVPRKRSVETRCETLLKSKHNLNVLIMGSDSISRAHFHRTMTKTADYLMKNLSAIEMMGYNKVAQHTYPNVLAATSGSKSDELKHACSVTRYLYLDRCKLIWEDYKTAGYWTALSEEMGFAFTLQPEKSGFCKPPTDYYPSPFLKAAIKDNYKAHLGPYCLGVRYRYNALLKYVGRFVHSSSKYPYFGIFFQDSYTHEGLNNGYLIDHAYYSFLKKLSRHKSFNKTVLIFFSDHGFHNHVNYMLTTAAQMESKLPLLSFVFPTWFRKKYSKAICNMEGNVHRLTTHYDLYETLKDLIDYQENLNESALEQRNGSLINDPLPRGISLFLPIPQRRTCDDAGIPWDHCACHQHVHENIKSPLVQYLSEQVVRYINLQIRPYPQCAQVTLNKTINAVVSRSIIGSARTNGSFGHRVTFITNPGAAVFIATALNVENKFKQKENNSFDFIESISRLDIYKYQSFCVDEYKVQQFCFCNETILEDSSD